MDDAHLPDDPAFRAAMRDYMRWATDEMVAHPSPDETIPPDLPMPHWSWDGPETTV
jgi:hemoglobin